MVKPPDRHEFSVHMRIHRSGHRATPPWLVGRVHPRTRHRWLHDRLCDQHRSESSPWPDGYHWFQVCPPFHSRRIANVSRNSTRAPTYQVIINTLKGLGRTKEDAAFGLVGLFTLYAIRMTCDHLSKRYPRRGLLYLAPLSPLCLTFIAQPECFSSSQHSVVPS